MWKDIKPADTNILLMGKIIRAGVSFPEELLKSFDEIVEELNLGSRSRGIQEAMRTFISLNAWRLPENQEVAGAILIHYSHEERGLDEKLIDIQHEFLDIIPSMMHIHLSEDSCLQIIVVRGRASKVRELIKELRRVGRLKQLNHLLIPTY